jgi:hypothetical protein
VRSWPSISTRAGPIAHCAFRANRSSTLLIACGTRQLGVLAGIVSPFQRPSCQIHRATPWSGACACWGRGPRL